MKDKKPTPDERGPSAERIAQIDRALARWERESAQEVAAGWAHDDTLSDALDLLWLIFPPVVFDAREIDLLVRGGVLVADFRLMVNDPARRNWNLEPDFHALRKEARDDFNTVIAQAAFNRATAGGA